MVEEQVTLTYIKVVVSEDGASFRLEGDRTVGGSTALIVFHQKRLPEVGSHVREWIVGIRWDCVHQREVGERREQEQSSFSVEHHLVSFGCVVRTKSASDWLP